MFVINMYHRLRQRDEEGQALVEYALILALIAVVALTALEAIGTGVTGALDAIASAIGAAVP